MLKFRLVARAVATAPLFILAQCTKQGAQSCPLSSEPAVVVDIRDNGEGLPLAAVARGVIRDGAYVDSLRPHEGRGTAPFVLTSRAAGFDRPGTYSVEVYAPGYKAWRRDGVTVIQGACRVRTRNLHAELVASS